MRKHRICFAAPLVRIGALLALFALAACGPEGATTSVRSNAAPPAGSAAGTPGLGRMTIVNGAPLVAQNPGEVAGIVSRFLTVRGSRERAVLINDIDLLLASETGRTYIGTPGAKALAIGTPADSCPRYEIAQARNPALAVQDVLNQCLAYVDAVEARSGDACGCQVVAINGSLLVGPADLPYRRRLPMHLIWSMDASSDVQRRVGVGEVVEGGANNANRFMTFEAADGTQLCTGRMQETAPAAGNMVLICDALSAHFDGEYEVQGHREGRPYGVASLTGDGVRASLMFGYSEAEYQEARAPVLEELLVP